MMTFLLMIIVNVFGKRIIKESLLPFETPIEESSFIINTNQGRFALNNTKATMESIVMLNTMNTILASTSYKNTTIEMSGALRDVTATLKKAWVRFTFPHVSLLMQFNDGRCEEMEWYPLNSRLDIPGEHPAGKAILHYDVGRTRCRNAPSMFGLPDSTVGVYNWLQDAIKLKSTQKTVDLLRWTPVHLQHVTRREVYDSFVKEAYRFKDEEKYSCSSFINNAFGIATGHIFVDPAIMVQLLQVGAKRFGIAKGEEKCKGAGESCSNGNQCCSNSCILGGGRPREDDLTDPTLQCRY